MGDKKKVIAGCVITFFATAALFIAGVGVYFSNSGFDYMKFLDVKRIVDGKFIYDYDENKMTDYAIAGMVGALGDPYSAYYDKASFEARMNNFSGSYVGIGIVMTYAVGNDFPVIQSVYEGSTAESVGLVKGDQLLKADGQDFTHENYDEVIKYVKGEHINEPKGTELVLTVLRAQTGENEDITITRDKIKTSKVEYEMVKNNIGYLRVSSFDGNTVPGLETALAALNAKNMKGLVFDIRGCPGGDLEAVTGALDIFLDEGVIVYMEDVDGNKRYRYAKDGKDEIPMVVLIDGNSASASEVFAGAIRDYDRAELVGTTSFGKGIVQSLFSLPGGEGLSLTTEEYFLPKGSNIHGIGIEPDVNVELSEGSLRKTIPQLTYEEDLQLQKAVDMLSHK